MTPLPFSVHLQWNRKEGIPCTENSIQRVTMAQRLKYRIGWQCSSSSDRCSVRTEGYRNTCELKTAIHEEAEKTRGMMMASQIQDLRDRLADRDRDLQSANFNLSQVLQTSAIVGQLRPFPQPAYITASPYQALTGYGLCRCSTGTGTGTGTT